ncbi:MAG: hypothetical protein ABSB30_00900 [Terracidiphilus sp.]|jgi:hypothetical protein
MRTIIGSDAVSGLPVIRPQDHPKQTLSGKAMLQQFIVWFFMALGGQRTSDDVTRITDLAPIIRVSLVFSASPASGPQPHRL